MKKGDRIVIDFDGINAALWRESGYDENPTGVVTRVEGNRINVDWDNRRNSAADRENFKLYEDKNVSLPNKMFKRKE